MTKAIVLGGSGFIGTHLTRHLSQRKVHQEILSLDKNPPHERIPGVIYATADLTAPIPTHYGSGGATIYNLVAERDYPSHQDATYYNVNVISTQRAIDFAESTNAKTIVFTSTMSVYGDDEQPKTEGSSLSPGNPYGNSKRICEILHQSWLRRTENTQLIICRPAVIFGHYDRGNYTRLASALRRGFFVFVGRKDTIKSAGYVGDLVRSFTFCVGRPEREIVYNFSYPRAYTIAEITDALCRVGGFKKPRLVLPLFALNLAALPFEAIDRVGLRNPIHRDRLVKLYKSTHIVPSWLTDKGFEFETDLELALAKWADASQSRFD